MEAWHFLADQDGLEEGFRASELLVSDADVLTVREFVSSVV